MRFTAFAARSAHATRYDAEHLRPAVACLHRRSRDRDDDALTMRARTAGGVFRKAPPAPVHVTLQQPAF